MRNVRRVRDERAELPDDETFEAPTVFIEVPEVSAEVLPREQPPSAEPRSSWSIARAEPVQVPVNAEPPTGMATAAQVEAFRELRTRLLAIAAGVKRTHFTTLVVPMTRGSGASFVARNLAVAFALQDAATAVLIDCNRTDPTQHVALRTRAELGLFDFLDEPHPQVDRLLQATTFPRLHLIPAGRPKSTVREYFSSNALRRLMATVEKCQYFVFLDGPTATGSPDARILSELADFVVLVVGYGRNTPEDIAEATAMFDPAKFAGVVFNERA